MSPERLVTVFEHAEWIQPEVLAEIADEIGIETVEDLDGLFQRAAGRQLGRRAIGHFRNITRPTRNAARPVPEEGTPRQAPSIGGRAGPDLVSRRMLKALSADIVDDETETDAAAEVGWLVAQVRGLNGRVQPADRPGLLVLGVLVQVAFRLD